MEYKEILQLVDNKDKRGLEELYQCYGRKFYDYAVRRWFFSEDEAWEVVYKTLETLVVKLNKYQFESKIHFENFIFKVFVNYLRQFYRNKRKNLQENLSIEQENALTEKSSEVNINESRSTINELDNSAIQAHYNEEDEKENPKLIALRKALQQMNALDREILLLRAQNYSYEEIALMLKIKNNQLKVKYHRAKSKLKELIIHN